MLLFARQGALCAGKRYVQLFSKAGKYQQFFLSPGLLLWGSVFPKANSSPSAGAGGAPALISPPSFPGQPRHTAGAGQRITPGRCPLASAGIDAGGPGRGLPLCIPLPDCFACPPSPRHLPRQATPHGRGDRDGRNANHHHRAWFWGMSRDISSDSARNLSLRQPRNFHIDNQSIFTRMF